MDDRDSLQRFLFPDHAVRGELVQLDASYRQQLATHAYPAPIARLLGEFLSAAALLSATLKFEGQLVLQYRSDSALRLVMAECSHQQDLRAIARYDEALDEAALEVTESSATDLAIGQLAITIEPERGRRYQGIVPVESGSLATALEGYFRQSEQLATRIWLDSDSQRTAGLLLQALPASPDAAEQQLAMQHLATLTDTLTREELLNLPANELLYRLYHEESVELYPPQPLRFHCSCSAERSANALLSLGRDDVEQLLDEQGGKIEIDCQFCRRVYHFDAAEIGRLFDATRH